LRRDLLEFWKWLQARRPEIEEMALVRVYGVADPGSVRDPGYVAGLRAAVSAALAYGLTGFELGEERAGPAPAVLLTQARHAARSGVDLDTVLRRYIAGYALLGDFVIQAIEEGDFELQMVDLRRIWRIQATLLDRLVAAVTAEYRNEMDGRPGTTEERRVKWVKRLLAGQFLEPDQLQYEFDAWHIGAIALGPGAQGLVRDLATKLDRRLLIVCPGGGTIWAWLSGQRKITAKEIEDLAPRPWPSGISLALGEPERSLAGWRLSHRQAKAAAPISLRPLPRLVRYAEVTLLSAALSDEVLASSLQRLYLDPLAHERDGGAALRHTLRAYFVADRNVSSTAAALGVSRQTVSSRLRIVEERVCRSLDTCAPEVDTALRLEELGHLSRPLTTLAFA
jgi:hypothetical protein